MITPSNGDWCGGGHRAEQRTGRGGDVRIRRSRLRPANQSKEERAAAGDRGRSRPLTSGLPSLALDRTKDVEVSTCTAEKSTSPL
ncbi:hypothetical protein MRX96_047045 [Rhipicephalus microplus]